MTRPTSAGEVSENHRARSIGVGRAHAKAIVLGEHAVVYGAAAIALPVPQMTVTASAAWSPQSSEDPGDVSFTMMGPRHGRWCHRRPTDCAG